MADSAASPGPSVRPDPSGNGGAFRVDAGQLIGNAVARQLAPVFTAIQNALVRRCAVCLNRRIAWEMAHQDALLMAEAAAREAASADFTAFLPAGLQPGDPADGERMPLVGQAITMAAGWDACAGCLPLIVSESSEPAPGASRIALAPAVSASAAARMAAQ